MNKELTPNLCICAADLHSCNQTKFSEALFWHFKHLQHKPRFDRNIKFHSGTRNTLNFQSSCTLHHILIVVVMHLADESSKKRIVFLQSDKFCILILYIWESCEACIASLFCTVRWKVNLNLYIFVVHNVFCPKLR